MNDIHCFIGRFVSYPSEDARVAHTLWIGHTHLMDRWESTPRLAFLSPEPASGKSRALEVTEPLVPHPMEAVNVSACRSQSIGSDDGLPTILYDEVDTMFGPRTKDNNEDIRGLLNAGTTRAPRPSVGGRKQVTVEAIEVYCAVAFAGLGWLPHVVIAIIIVHRAAVTKMKRY